LVDALGNPLKMVLTAGQVHDLAGADALLPDREAAALLADKAYDADERVIEPLQAAGKTAVIPPKRNRTNPRPYDKVLYQARHGSVRISVCETFSVSPTIGQEDSI
jgi:transposase